MGGCNISTLKEVAEKLGVSTMTVSNVINKRYSKVSVETRERVEKALKDMNYQPNLSARSLVSKRSMIVVLVITFTEEEELDATNTIQNPFYSELIRTVEYELRKQGYFLMLRYMKKEENIQNLLNKWNAEGVIILGDSEDVVEDIVKPVVLIDNYKHNKVSTVNTEDYEGVKVGIQYLIDNGHKEIAYLTSPLSDKGVSWERYKGYSEVLKDNNLTLDENIIFEGNPDIEFAEKVAGSIVNEKTNVSAIYCHSDLVAVSLIRKLKSLGKNIPEDYSVISFDGLLLSMISHPELTSLSQDVNKKGRQAVNLLVNHIEDETFRTKNIKIPVELKVRNSVKRI